MRARAAALTAVARPSIAVAVVALIVVAPVRVTAAEYFYDPVVSLSALYESNPRLRQMSKDSGGAVLDVAVEVGARSPVSSVSLTPHIQTYRYDDNTLNRTDRELGIALERALSERFKLGTTGLISRVSTLVSEASDTGVVGRRNRDTGSVAPYLSWQVGVRDELVAKFSYMDVNYTAQNEDNNGLIDHDFRVASLAWNRQWTPATDGFVEAFGSEFRNKVADCQTQSVGGRVGLKVAVTPTMRFGGSLGYVSSDSDFETFTFQLPGDAVDVFRSTDCRRPPVDAVNPSGPVGDSSRNQDVLAGFSVQKDFSSISSAKAGYDRSIAASGRGVQTIRDRFSLGVDQTLSERVRVSIDGSYQESKSDAGDSRDQGRSNDVVQAEFEMRYKLSEEAYLGAGYRYRWRKQDFGLAGSDGGLDNHTALIVFGYDIKPRTLLR